MKILFVLENYFPHVGGAEIVFQNLCEGLAKRGHDVSIVTHHLKNTKRYEEINGVKVYRVMSCGTRYIFTFSAIPKVFHLARDADVINATTFNAAFPAWLISKIRRKPSVLTVHEVWVGKWNKITDFSPIKCRIHDILERMIYLLNFDRYACVSRSTQKQVIKLGKKKNKTRVIYNAIDYDLWDPRKYDRHIRKKLGIEKDFVALFSGRPGISKGLEYLIAAVARVKIKNFKLLAKVSKDPAYIKRYRFILQLIKKFKVEDKVIMHEPDVYQMMPYYVKAADCMVVPSLSEGFGFSAAEACAMGVPVVASNTASLPEVVSGKYVLVKPKNVEDIARGIELVHAKRYKTSKLKRFLLKDNIDGYLKLYDEIR